MSDRLDRTFLKCMFSNVMRFIQLPQNGGMSHCIPVLVMSGVLVIMAICVVFKSSTLIGRVVKTVRLLVISPADLYRPYVVLPLQNTPSKYQHSFKHRFAGKQEVILNIINNDQKKFDYNNPDMLNLEFSGTISDENQEVKKEFMEKFTNYYLMQGTNSIPLYRYEIWTNKLLKARYLIDVEIRGDLKAFIGRYPGSFLSVGNATVK